mgnify:CR=1 FL=1
MNLPYIGIEPHLECANFPVPRFESRGSGDCIQTINVLEQEFDVLWCGYGCRYTFINETILITSLDQFHPTFSIALTSGRLRYHCARNQKQRLLNLPRRYLIGSSDIGTVSGSLKRSSKNSNHFFQCLVKISDKVVDHF